MAKLQRETDVANVLSQMSQLVQYPHESGKLSDNNISNEPDEHAYAQNSSRSDKPASCLNSKSSSKGNNIQSAVSGKKHVCELCGRAFGKLCNLKSHLRVHSGDRPHTCDVCSHAFGSLWDLIKHSRIHSGEKPYKCCYCGRCFAAFGSHQRHLRLHTNEKPYQCHVCSKDFSRLDSYKNHLNTHSDDKPFICQKCDKKFAYQSSYKRHMNTHDLGEKRFTCNACNKSFTRHDYLIVHTRKHDEQENHDEDKKRVDDASLDSVIDINEGELLLCPSTEIQSSSSYSVNADLSPIPILLSMAECTVVNGSMCNTMEYLDSASLLAAASEIELGTSGEMSTSHYDVGIDLETCPITAASQSENNAISEKSAFESQSDQQKKPHDESGYYEGGDISLLYKIGLQEAFKIDDNQYVHHSHDDDDGNHGDNEDIEDDYDDDDDKHGDNDDYDDNSRDKGRPANSSSTQVRTMADERDYSNAFERITLPETTAPYSFSF